MRAALIVVVGVSLWSACLSVPDPGGLPPQCTQTSDCNSAAGEICDTGVCWGNPPSGMFEALVGAPASNTALAQAESSNLDISADGWFPDLVLPPSVTFSGRVEMACPASPNPNDGDCGARPSVAAQVTITRPPRIAGGPQLRVVTTSAAGLMTGASFTVQLPRSLDNENYVVTVVPAHSDPATSTTVPDAVDAPPVRRLLSLTEDSNSADFELSDPSLPILSGVVPGYANFRVVARARWTGDAATEELSTIAITDAVGAYQLTLPLGIDPGIEIVASPPSTVIAPTLRRMTMLDSSGYTQLSPMRMPAFAPAITVTLPVEGLSSAGSLVPVPGAQVTVNTNIVGGLGSDPQLRAQFSATATSDVGGNASLTVLPGSTGDQAYTIRVKPPIDTSDDAPFGVVLDQAITLPYTQTSFAAVTLPRRVALRGTITDHDGSRLQGVSITSTPSLAFSSELDDDSREFLNELAPANESTNNQGEFVVWVDASIGQFASQYDISIEPQTSSGAPRWNVPSIAPSSAGVDLGVVALPAASFVRSHVLARGGGAIEGADVRLFAAPAPTTCGNGNGSGQPCTPAAIELGSDVSDANGLVWFALPRP